MKCAICGREHRNGEAKVCPSCREKRPLLKKFFKAAKMVRNVAKGEIVPEKIQPHKWEFKFDGTWTFSRNKAWRRSKGSTYYLRYKGASV